MGLSAVIKPLGNLFYKLEKSDWNWK